MKSINLIPAFDSFDAGRDFAAIVALHVVEHVAVVLADGGLCVRVGYRTEPQRWNGTRRVDQLPLTQKPC